MKYIAHTHIHPYTHLYSGSVCTTLTQVNVEGAPLLGAGVEVPPLHM